MMKHECIILIFLPSPQKAYENTLILLLQEMWYTLSTGNVKMIVFFDDAGAIYQHAIAPINTASAEYYVSVLKI